jgi:EmrB/QacA subfamily drug resistance transporter
MNSIKSSLVNVDRKWLVLIAIGMSTFMSALDTSVVNTVLPVISKAFKTDIATVEWVVIIYLLIVTGLLLSFGRLGDIRGHKSIFLTGFSIFLISSALCGWAQKIEFLIIFRGIQALGAAMLAANSPAILTKNFPSSQRGQALGLQATMTYLGLTAAPSLGGWLTDLISWRAVFYINIPVGGIAFLLAWVFIPQDGQEKIREQLDFLGAFLFLAGLIALLLGLNQGSSWGWLSPTIIGLFLFAGIFLVVFIFIEKRRASPLLDLSLFYNRVFSASVISAVLNYMAVFSILFLMPFYLLQGREFSPSQAGLILTVQPIVMAIIAPISGSISDRIGTRIPTASGLVILAIGMFMMSQLGPNSPISQIGIVLAIVGFGTGTFISPNNSAIMGAAPKKEQGIAAGLLATARSTGMVLGVGIAGAIFTSVMASAESQNPVYVAFSTSLLIAAGFAAIGAFFSAFKK